MKRLQSKTGLVLAIAYFGLFILTGVFAISEMIANPLHSEFSGMFTIIVTLPWSMLFAPLLDSLGIVKWYNQFASSPLFYGFLATMAMLPGATINTGILYFIGRLFDGLLAQEPPVIAIDSDDISPIIGPPEQVKKIWKKFNLFFWPFFLIRIAGLAIAVLPAPELSRFIPAITTVDIFSVVGEIVVLSYFSYALTHKKPYLFVGVTVLVPVLSLMGLTGYIILWVRYRARKLQKP